MDMQAYCVCSAENKWGWEGSESSSCSLLFTQISCVKSIGSEFQSISFISMVLARGHYEKCHIGKAQSRKPEAVSSWDGCIYFSSSSAVCQPQNCTGILSEGFTRELAFCISLWLLLIWQICSLHLLQWRKWFLLEQCGVHTWPFVLCTSLSLHKYLLISFLMENQKWRSPLPSCSALRKIQGSSCEGEPFLSRFCAAANSVDLMEMFPLKFS